MYRCIHHRIVPLSSLFAFLLVHPQLFVLRFGNLVTTETFEKRPLKLEKPYTNSESCTFETCILKRAIFGFGRN